MKYFIFKIKDGKRRSFVSVVAESIDKVRDSVEKEGTIIDHVELSQPPQSNLSISCTFALAKFMSNN